MTTFIKIFIACIFMLATHRTTAQQTFENACESVEPTTHSMYDVYVAVSIDEDDEVSAK